jgi:hypothetical protein
MRRGTDAAMGLPAARETKVTAVAAAMTAAKEKGTTTRAATGMAVAERAVAGEPTTEMAAAVERAAMEMAVAAAERAGADNARPSPFQADDSPALVRSRTRRRIQAGSTWPRRVCERHWPRVAAPRQ